MKRCFFCWLVALLLASPGAAATWEPDGGGRPTWIINSGGPANLPAGSLVALTAALERGARDLVLDLVLSGDGRVVVLPGPRLDLATDVADLFPDRARPEGGYYSFDFTSAELGRLARRQTAAATPFSPRFGVVSLAEALGCIDLLLAGSATRPHLICRLRQGWLHRQENLDLGATVLRELEAYRAASGRATFSLASYDPEELQELAGLTPAGAAERIGFIQLIDDDQGSEVRRLEFGRFQPYDFGLLFTRFGLKAVSTYASAIGLDPRILFDASGAPLHPGFLEDARTLEMQVIAWPAAAEPLPAGDDDDEFGRGLEQLLFTFGFDGLVTAGDARVRQWLATRSAASASGRQTTIEQLIERVEGRAGASPIQQSDQPR